MDPVTVGRPLLALAVGMIILSALLLPFLERGTSEFVVTLLSLILNIIFVTFLIPWIKKAGKGEKSGND